MRFTLSALVFFLIIISALLLSGCEGLFGSSDDTSDNTTYENTETQLSETLRVADDTNTVYGEFYPMN